jgi:hypothetical protein
MSRASDHSYDRPQTGREAVLLECPLSPAFWFHPTHGKSTAEKKCEVNDTEPVKAIISSTHCPVPRLVFLKAWPEPLSHQAKPVLEAKPGQAGLCTFGGTVHLRWNGVRTVQLSSNDKPSQARLACTSSVERCKNGVNVKQ